MYKYLFGPVLSRRLGVSLGIDPFLGTKICNMDCLYCECGKTKLYPMPVNINIDLLKKEIKSYLDKNPAPDFLTVSGCGEPALLSNFDEFVKELLKFISDTKIKLALITNGTIFIREDLFDSLSLFNVIMPSLDATTADVFNKINRPVLLDLNKLIMKSLIEFKQKINLLYKKSGVLIPQIWLETLFIHPLNTNKYELEKILGFIKELLPDRFQINTVDRPPAYSVSPVNDEILKRIYTFFLESLSSLGIRVDLLSRKNIVSHRKLLSFSLESFIDILKRRPLSYEDVFAIFNVNERDFNNMVKDLIKKGFIKITRSKNMQFFVWDGGNGKW